MSRLSQRIGIDTRGLAAFRIGVGAVILLDLVLRARSLVVFYTDNGVWPRSLNELIFPALHSLSIHARFGSLPAQGVLFVLAGVAATALVVGYRTTLATVVSAVLLLSLQFRNPAVLTAGDITLSVLLFFAIVLPLGERYSLDAVHSESGRERVSGVRTAGPLLFVVVNVYGVNAITHLRGERWVSGEAVETVFALDSVTVFLGEVVAGHSILLTAVNWTWIAMLVAAPTLILSSGRVRSALTVLYISAHLGILVTMYLVTFPLVDGVALLLFLPSEAWDRVTTHIPQSVTRSLTDYARQAERRLYWQIGLSVPNRIVEMSRFLGSAAVIIILITFSAWGATTLHSQGDAPTIVPIEQERYPLAVFSPEPLHTDGWYVVPTTLESGLVVDAYSLDSVNWDRPPDLDRTYAGPRWTTYMIAGQSRLYTADDPVIDRFAGYLCNRAANHYTAGVENVTVYFVEDQFGNSTTTRLRLVQRACR